MVLGTAYVFGVFQCRLGIILPQRGWRHSWVDIGWVVFGLVGVSPLGVSDDYAAWMLEIEELIEYPIHICNP